MEKKHCLMGNREESLPKQRQLVSSPELLSHLSNTCVKTNRNLAKDTYVHEIGSSIMK